MKTSLIKKASLLLLVMVLMGKSTYPIPPCTAHPEDLKETFIDENGNTINISIDGSGLSGEASGDSSGALDKVYDSDAWQSFIKHRDSFLQLVKWDEYKSTYKATLITLASAYALHKLYTKGQEKVVMEKVETTPFAEEIEIIDAKLADPSTGLQERQALRARRKVVVQEMITNHFGNMSNVRAIAEILRAWLPGNWTPKIYSMFGKPQMDDGATKGIKWDFLTLAEEDESTKTAT